jgi:hypothetical protein
LRVPDFAGTTRERERESERVCAPRVISIT